MNKNMAAKLSSWPCFEALGLICCQDFCSYFCFAYGGGAGVARVLLSNNLRDVVTALQLFMVMHHLLEILQAALCRLGGAVRDC